MQISDAGEIVNPKPKSRVPSVTHNCPAVLVVAWQYRRPAVTRNMLATVGADVGGTVGGHATVGDDEQPWNHGERGESCFPRRGCEFSLPTPSTLSQYSASDELERRDRILRIALLL